MEQQNQQQETEYVVPPNFISTKDFAYLEDMLNWNFIAMKKAHFFAKHAKDEDIKGILEEIGVMHEQHFLDILYHLEPKSEYDETTIN